MNFAQFFKDLLFFAAGAITMILVAVAVEYYKEWRMKKIMRNRRFVK